MADESGTGDYQHGNGWWDLLPLLAWFVGVYIAGTNLPAWADPGPFPRALFAGLVAGAFFVATRVVVSLAVRSA